MSPGKLLKTWSGPVLGEYRRVRLQWQKQCCKDTAKAQLMGSVKVTAGCGMTGVVAAWMGPVFSGMDETTRRPEPRRLNHKCTEMQTKS